MMLYQFANIHQRLKICQESVQKEQEGVPMVAWATNNRCWHGIRMRRIRYQDFVPTVADLRNTAFGASSPAKPALHMPELEIG